MFSSPFAARATALYAAGRWRARLCRARSGLGLPSEWIVRVMRAESGGYAMRGGRPIRSRKGAIGLMQLMPGTWDAMRVQLGLGADPDDPRDNILAGTAYLRLMYDRFGYPGLFAAYNAGPARYAAYLRGEATLPSETVAYLAQVTGAPAPVSNAPAATGASVSKATPDPLFVVRRVAAVVAQPGGSEASPPSLFAIRRDVR